MRRNKRGTYSISFPCVSSDLQEKTGQVIRYGEVVQLLHLRSQKWLTVSDKLPSDTEVENFKVSLEHGASMFSWFTMRPSAAFHSDHDVVVRIHVLRCAVHRVPSWVRSTTLTARHTVKQ